MLECVNDVYSEAVDRAMPKGKVLVTHDYAARKDALPLPATLTIDLGRHISERSESGMQVRLYSDYPWKFRDRRRPDRRLRARRAAPAAREPGRAGLPVRGLPGPAGAAVRDRPADARDLPRLPQQRHRNSPKRDWKVGDVRGVLEIIRPLDRDAARARAGLRETFVLVGVVAGSLLGLTVAVVVIGGRRGRGRGKSCNAPAFGDSSRHSVPTSLFHLDRRPIMVPNTRREFLADVGRGMLVASVGAGRRRRPRPRPGVRRRRARRRCPSASSSRWSPCCRRRRPTSCCRSWSRS